MAPCLFIKFLSKAVYLKTFYICNLLSLWALSNCCDPFERCISYSHDQNHVHSTYFTNFYTKSCASIPQNKNSMLFMAILSKLQGHGLLKKILDTWRSKVFKRERKEIWTHEGPICFKRKLAHVQKKIREKSSWKEFTYHSIHLHILIKVYDLFLLRIRSLT